MRILGGRHHRASLGSQLLHDLLLLLTVLRDILCNDAADRHGEHVAFSGVGNPWGFLTLPYRRAFVIMGGAGLLENDG